MCGITDQEAQVKGGGACFADLMGPRICRGDKGRGTRGVKRDGGWILVVRGAGKNGGGGEEESEGIWVCRWPLARGDTATWGRAYDSWGATPDRLSRGCRPE